MTGSDACSPVLDSKTRYSLLGDKYRIVVVERAGYGLSEGRWQAFQQNYVGELSNGQLIQLDCSYYVYNIELQ